MLTLLGISVLKEHSSPTPYLITEFSFESKLQLKEIENEIKVDIQNTRPDFTVLDLMERKLLGQLDDTELYFLEPFSDV